MTSAVEKLVFVLTQRYDASSGKVVKRFVVILSVKIDGVRARKWSVERVIVFQSVILQRAKGDKNSAKIRKRIFFRLDLWNRGAFDELVKDTYNSAMGYLVKSCGTQTMEERHQMFLNLVLKGKLRKAVRFVYEREKGGFFQPDELAEDRTGTINDTVASVLEGKHPSEKISSCAELKTYEETPIFIPIDITEEAIESVARKLSGSYGPGGT